jgi:hypothetical protein
MTAMTTEVVKVCLLRPSSRKNNQEQPRWVNLSDRMPGFFGFDGASALQMQRAQ